MLISAIVPIYNSSKTLKNCIDSIISQKNFKDYEIILVDDGSTDNSYEIAKEYEKKYPNLIKAHTFPNGGVSVARSIGVSIATGEFIVFVDSDDTINPFLLRKIAAILMTYPKMDVIRYQVNLLNDEEHKDHNRHNCMTNSYSIMSGIEAIMLWSGPGKKYALFWLYCFRKSLFRSAKMPNLRHFGDVAYVPILIANSNTAINVDYVGYNYECNNKHSLSNDTNYDNAKNRAIDFIHACQFAVEHFSELDFITVQEVNQFKKDYERRLKGYFYSLPDKIRDELSDIYCLPVNRE